MNTNGLISCRDVSATGAPESNFFLRANEPIITPSPFVIQSQDNTEEATLSLDNNGSFVLSANSIALEAQNNFNIAVGNATGGGAGFLSKPVDQVAGAGGISIFNGSASATPTYFTTYNASVNTGGLTAGNLQTFGYSGANTKLITSFSSNGASAIVGDASTAGGAVLSVNGPLGPSRVFDALYNIPSSSILTPIYSYDVPGNQRSLFSRPGNVNNGLFILPTGIYQLSAFYNNMVQNPVYQTMDLVLLPNISALIPESKTRIVASASTSGAGSYVSTVSGAFQVTSVGTAFYSILVLFNGTPANPNDLDLWTSDNFAYSIVKL